MATQAVQVDFLLSGATDSAGLPLDAGTAGFYETDGTTLKTIYDDAQKAVNASNPITLGADGTAVVFADGIYDIIVKNSAGTTVDTYENVFYDPNETTAELGYIDASTFGSGDDANAISLAITSAAGADRTVYLKPQAWDIDADLTIPSNINLKFEFGAYATVANTFTLTVTGTIEAPLYQILRVAGTGSVTIDDRNLDIPSIWLPSGVHDSMTQYGLRTFINGIKVTAEDSTLPGHFQANDDGVNKEVFRFDRISASPADNDTNDINFYSENDNDQQVSFGKIQYKMLDVSDTTEKGEISFWVADGVDGSIDKICYVDIDGFNVDNLTIKTNTLSSTSGDLNLTPVAGSSVVVDGAWSFDGNSLTLSGGMDSIITAAAGYSVNIELTEFDGGIVNAGSTGAVGAPAYSFSTDSDTGMYSDASNSINFTTGGTKAFTLNASQGAVLVGDLQIATDSFFVAASTSRVGIGTVSPAPTNTNANSEGLHISNATTNPAELRLSQSGGSNISIASGSSGSFIYGQSNHPIDIYTNSLSRFIINADGTGQYKGTDLQVDGTLTQVGILSVNNSSDSTSTTTGSIHTDGGLGVVKSLYVGENIHAYGSSNSYVDISAGTGATPALVKLLGDNNSQGSGCVLDFYVTSSHVGQIETVNTGSNKGLHYDNPKGDGGHYFEVAGSVIGAFDSGGNFYIGAGLATTATDGFLYIPSFAGTPTGVPTSHSGTVPFGYDSTNNKLYIYDGGWVSTAALT